MKTTLIYLACSIFLVNSCNGNNCDSEREIITVKQSQDAYLKGINQNDTLLNNIQQKVMNAFVKDQISQSDKEMIALEQALLNLNKNKKNNIITYWYSYTCYYHSILFTIRDEDKSSEKILFEGIKTLNGVSLKNSEHYALLALMEGFSIQFASGIEVPFISKRANQNAEKALLLDSLNLRAYFVLGSNDFYTPEKYSGGKKAEGYLLKAIKLNDQSVSSSYLPSWGKDSAYELLIRLCLNRKQFSEAKRYFKEANALFPDNYMINKLASELIGN